MGWDDRTHLLSHKTLAATSKRFLNSPWTCCNGEQTSPSPELSIRRRSRTLRFLGSIIGYSPQGPRPIRQGGTLCVVPEAKGCQEALVEEEINTLSIGILARRHLKNSL